jgi:hypothetical protein
LRVSSWISLLVLGFVGAACQGAPAKPNVPPPPALLAAASDFSGDAAVAQLEALAGIGSRVSGTPGAARLALFCAPSSRSSASASRSAASRGRPGPTALPRSW